MDSNLVPHKLQSVIVTQKLLLIRLLRIRFPNKIKEIQNSSSLSFHSTAPMQNVQQSDFACVYHMNWAQTNRPQRCKPFHRCLSMVTSKEVHSYIFRIVSGNSGDCTKQFSTVLLHLPACIQQALNTRSFVNEYMNIPSVMAANADKKRCF